MKTTRLSPFVFRLLAGAITVALIAGTTVLAARRAERLLRADLLLQASLVASSLCSEHVAKLSGTADDYTSPDYRYVHELLKRIWVATPNCRFLYLIERRPDGVVIFTDDSEPFDSKDHSPPGQTYDEAPAELHAAFAANQAIVRGPYGDRWGTWVSAFVPLSDPKSTMLGMDIDAHDWKQKVALRAALPAVLTAIVILFGLLAILLQQSRRKHRSQHAVLQEAEAQKQAILNGITTNIALVDPNLKILWANQAAANSVHKRTEDLVGQPCHSFWGDPSRPCVNCPTLAAFQTGKPEHQIIHTQDGRIWDETGEPIFDANGIVVAVVEIASDITQRTRNESSLQESEVKYRRLIENSHDIIYALTAEGVFTFVSPAWTALLGHQVDQVVGQPFQPFVHPDDLPGCMVFLKSVIEKGQPQSGAEYRVRHVDGSWRWHVSSAVPLRDETGTVVGLEGTASDVTERKQATERIRVLLDEANQSRRAMLGIIEDEARSKADLERLAMAINQGAETVVVTDAHGLIQYVNPAFEKVTGYSRQEALGQNPRVLKSGKHDAEFYRRMWGLLAAGETWSGHLINKRKDGTLYEEDATISPVRDASGKIVNYVAVKRDVTHEVQLEEQLRQSQKMDAVGRLAGGVAHDFNNQLMVIMGNTELCLEQIDSGHPLREFLDVIMRSSMRSAEITRQLLAFARKQNIAPIVLDINDAVAGMLKLLQRLIGEDIKLAWLPGVDLRPVKLDPAQIDQILANLCVNARDAIAGVGQITVETGSIVIGADFCVKHPEATPGDYVLLAVRDDGCGMDKATMSQIFEPFFTTKGVGKGTGLGLSTVYGIVKQNNGFIYATSELGKGTTFKLYFPQVEAEMAQTTEKSMEEAPRGHGETILLAEDEKLLGVICRRFLESLDYNVLLAETPEEALMMAAHHPGDIHVLLTDVVMPGMDGRQLAQRISAVKLGVKVLFMSGYTADVIAQRGVLEEGVQFLSKPFSRDDLACKLREVLESD